jgi:hypothetical protein
VICTSILRYALGAMLRRLPGQGKVIRRLWHQIQGYRYARTKARLAAASGWRLSDPDRVLLLSPTMVVGHTRFQPEGSERELRNAVFGPDVIPGSVLDGDWDIDAPPFEALAAYRSIEQRLRQGTPWCDTEYFAESMRDINAGRTLWNCRNGEDLEARLQYIDSVVDSVRQHGMLRQTEVTAQHDPTRRYSDEVEVNVARNGAILFQDGRHRLAIAKVLKVPLIPVKVRVRHRQWQVLREQVLDLRRAADDGTLMLPYPAPHPDFGDIAADDTAQLAIDALLNIPLKKQLRVLDLEGRLGFVSWQLAIAGHEVATFESDDTLRRIGAGVCASLLPGLRWLAECPTDMREFDLVVAFGSTGNAQRSPLEMQQLTALIGHTEGPAVMATMPTSAVLAHSLVHLPRNSRLMGWHLDGLLRNRSLREDDP